MDMELLSHFSALPISLRMAINESNLPCTLKVHERTSTKDKTHESSKPNRYKLPKNTVIKIEKETSLHLVQIRVKCGGQNTGLRSEIYIPVGYRGFLIHMSSKPDRKSYDTVAEIGDAFPLCVIVDCDLTTTMMTGRKIQLTKGTRLWPLHIVKDNSNDEQYLSCFTEDKTISLPFGCAGKFKAIPVYLKDLENCRLPKTVQMENKVQFSDILSESENEARFLLDSGTTPIEVISFKNTSVYVGFVTQLDTLNGKHILVIPDDFQQLDLELVNLLTSSSPSILKEINDYFFSWTDGIDLECIHEKLFCVDNDPCFIYLKYFSQHEDYVCLTEVTSAGSEQSLQKDTATPVYANDLLFQTKNIDNVVAGETGNADRTSSVPDLPPRKPRMKNEPTKHHFELQAMIQQIVSIPTDKTNPKEVATQRSTSSIMDMNKSGYVWPKSDCDIDDYLIPISSQRKPSVNKYDNLVENASNTSLTLWQLSGLDTVQENRVGNVDVTKDDKTFFDYNIEEVSACFKRYGLNKVGDICSTEKLDGIFFKDLTAKVFEVEPFHLSPTDINKLVTIVVNERRRK
ncbi:hypothetical protein CHS0354_019379 [Potamilus streckersoni]|uniref:CABIT domain-containing protein n=1 Tax=Potamilus streckersoni TaxID=2493646 RepID=A0AAE0VWT2_9BIVA|nr:hypothetical protein CHS0354_019379 [Potamilus streckersoni]